MTQLGKNNAKQKDKLFELMLQYRENFREGVPIFQLSNLSPQDLTKLLKKCLKENKPISEYIEFRDDVLY